jgi:hypothetical protein
MARWALLCCILLMTFPLAAHPRRGDAQSQKSGGSLTVEEVVKLSQTGVSEELIVAKIKKNGKAFDLSTDELVDLRKAGVSDNIIKLLLDPSQPYSPTSPPAASGAIKQYPHDVYARRVPVEPGLYLFPKDVSLDIDIKMLLGAKEGSKKKGRVVAYLIGPTSKTRIREAAPIFYMRLPEGKGIEEVVLIAFDCKNDRREIGMGPPGAELQFRPEAVRQFDSLEVGPHLFKITTGKLPKGEYLFFLVGSAEPPKGSYGKGYDFGIEGPQR